MTWRDDLQPASFRGVEFLCSQHDYVFGRRIELNQYPLRDEPFAEDLGRRAREWSVEAFVLGENYMARRDALITALETPGPGRLVHRWLGEVTAVVRGDCHLQESTREGGMARFSITFVEAGERIEPSARLDTADRVERLADAADAVAAEEFGDTFSVDDVHSFVAEAGAADAASILDMAEGAMRSVRPDALLDDLSAVTSGITFTRSRIARLIRSPFGLAQRFLDIIRVLGGNIANPLQGFSNLFGLSFPRFPSRTRSRRRVVTNQAAMRSLVRTATVTSAARAAAQTEFASYDQAVAVRDPLAQAIEEVAAETTNDRIYDALMALRAAVVADITARGADLARQVTYTPAAVLPALVVAYQVYGDIDAADDIVSRNRVRHPGFVPAAPIEVLVR